jgi:hypothetical protein
MTSHTEFPTAPSRIVRQRREIDLHNAMMMTHVAASPPMTPA